MTGNSRNLMDVLRDKILQQADPARPANALSGRASGGFPTTGHVVPLRWVGADGHIKHWFTLGVDSFDDADAIWY